MADDGAASENLHLDLRNRTLGFTTKDLLPVLLVALIGVFAYVMVQNLSAGQAQGFAGLAQILEKMNVYQQQSLEKMNANQLTLLELVHTNRQEMTKDIQRQTTQLQEQTAEIRRLLDDQTRLVHQDHVILDYNARQDPGNQVPLGTSPEQMRDWRLPSRGH